MVDLDLRDHYGSTPLSIAVRHGRAEAARLLLATGRVDINARGRFGRTPVWYTRRYGYAEVMQVLLDDARKNGISACENDLLIEVKPRSIKDSTSRCCDVCTLSIQDTMYYNCGICNSGDFDVCSECYGSEMHCLCIDHELIQKEGTERKDDK
jgi:ankyrin repeat protein